MKNIIVQEIKKTLADLKYDNENLDIHITVPKNKDFGDLSTNIAFLLAKNLGVNPIDIASKIKKSLDISLGFPHNRGLTIKKGILKGNLK